MNSYLDDKWGSVGLAFDPWAYSRAEQQGILLAIFKNMNVLTVLELTPSEMLDFCLDIEKLYNNVPYHSFNHAIDVVVKLYYVLCDLHAAAYLASYDIASLLIAGLCHDSGHPGMNNLFQKNAKTEFAQRYPDAILERYSMDLAKEYIAKHRLLRNVENLRDPMYSDSTTTEVDVATRMMNSILSAILHTDMSRHFNSAEECKVIVSVLSNKARRISEHEAYQKECLVDPLLQHSNPEQPTTSPETSTPYEPTPSPNINRLKTSGHVIRCRSPSEPPAPTKSLYSYSLLNPASTPSTTSAAGTLTPKSSIEDLDASAQMHLAESPTAGIGSLGMSRAMRGKGRRLQVRRSVSMRDALLDSTQRQTLINILLHAVDVFNPVLPWDMCKKWSDLMNAESFHQGDTEKKLGLPVSPNMDRTCTDQRQVSLDFGNIIIRPFFTELVSIFPVEDELLSALKANLQKWSQLSTDSFYEISAPAGANSHEYSWPIGPVRTPVSRANGGSLSEGRRLSIAAGTVEIPSSRLEMIRRHSHEGFEALHRRMVGRLFMKHLEKIQERRKDSYTATQLTQHLSTRPRMTSQINSGNKRSDNGRCSPLVLSPGTTPLWKEFDSDMLSPVTEAGCVDDSSAPHSATSAEFGTDSRHGKGAKKHYISYPQSPRTLTAVTAVTAAPMKSDTKYGVPMSKGLATASNESPLHVSMLPLRDPFGPDSNREHTPVNPHLINYRIDSLTTSGRLVRSASLDPSILSHMPTSYPSLAATDGNSVSNSTIASVKLLSEQTDIN
ncbi:hypothetical protein LPJ66_000982 [Kickxella alabastrina]|uniref:Uncharacterized protein n=1 Tax=Kickxella alabastrina TaxID=61397 RepID=A0ACC1IUL5_9FUNG|nr:hypothetical protein LPJ66_000982 [Kickxella alabastrina]